MSIEAARTHLAGFRKADGIREFPVSSATVELAAKALGTEEARIAKTLSFMIDGRAILIVAAGDMKIDNKKYRQEFGVKAKMLSPDEVSSMIGHEIGGVCPFGIKNGVAVYLDESLKRFSTVFPACGSSNSCIEMTCAELEKISAAEKWVSVCKGKNEASAIDF
jgi:Uncharacterized conserved protein